MNNFIDFVQNVMVFALYAAIGYGAIFRPFDPPDCAVYTPDIKVT